MLLPCIYTYILTLHTYGTGLYYAAASDHDDDNDLLVVVIPSALSNIYKERKMKEEDMNEVHKMLDRPQSSTVLLQYYCTAARQFYRL